MYYFNALQLGFALLGAMVIGVVIGFAWGSSHE